MKFIKNHTIVLRVQVNILQNRDQLSDVKLRFLDLFANHFFAMIKIVYNVSIEFSQINFTMIQ